MLPTGNVSLEQLIGIFGTLPLDLTFVDADDRVAFFTEGPDRVFARSKAIIGRKVHNCHPPKSVETVDQILSDFKAGRQNVAEFWINFQEQICSCPLLRGSRGGWTLSGNRRIDAGSDSTASSARAKDACSNTRALPLPTRRSRQRGHSIALLNQTINVISN